MPRSVIVEQRAAAPSKPRSAGVEIRILFATAGEPESDGAVRLAAAIASRYRAPVLALGVARPFPHGMSSLVSVRQPIALAEQSRRDLLALVRRSTHDLPETRQWEKTVVLGAPSYAINEIATQWGATLIVMGIGRHSRVDRMLHGETTVEVIKRATVPVLAVPSTMRTLPARVLAAVDFTPASVTAAIDATDIMQPDGTLILAHATGFGGVTGHPGDLVDLYRAGANAKMNAAVRMLRRHTAGRVESVILDDYAGEGLVAFARREQCDLIALGGHRMGLMDRIVIGSVRTRILRDAPCAVLVAPPRSER